MHGAEFTIVEAIIGICAVILLATAIYTATQKYHSAIPYTVLLLISGIILSVLNISYLEASRLNPSAVLYIFLPILLFESAFNFEIKEFRKVFQLSFLLATIGLVISALVFALILNILLGFDFLPAFLLGCVIASTDPIAVLAIFKQLGVPRKLQLLVDAESFLNDATSVIMFKIVLGIIATGSNLVVTPGEMVGSIVNFGYVLGAGALVGSAIGWLFAFYISKIKNNFAIEIALTIILAHLTYILTEHYLHASGIIAVLASGLIMGNYGRTKISPQVMHNMHMVWELLVFVTVSIVFFLIGYEIKIQSLISNFALVALGVGALLFSRALSVYLVAGIHNFCTVINNRIPLSWLHISNWGGLRGALPLIVILSLPTDFPYRAEFIQIVLGSILFTLIVNATTIKPLIKYLGIDRLLTADKIEVQITELILLENLSKSLDNLHKTNEISSNVYQKHKEKLTIALEKARKLIKDLDQNPSEGYNLEFRKIIERHALRVENSLYQELFKKDIINETIFVQLRDKVDSQLDELNQARSEFQLSEIDIDNEIARHSTNYLKLGILSKLLPGATYESRVRDTYTYHKVRMLGNEKVLADFILFKDLTNSLGSSIFITTHKKYELFFNHNKLIVSKIEKLFPKITEQVCEEFYHHECDSMIDKTIFKLGEEGRISNKALKELNLNI